MGVNPNDGLALMIQLRTLMTRSPQAVDAWIPAVHEAEYREFGSEYVRRFDADVSARPKGWEETLTAALKERRLNDPARRIDALLRQVGAVGSVAEFRELGNYGRTNGVRGSNTPWGRWKALAAMVEILNRSPWEGTLPPPSVVPREEDAFLLEDLDPDRAASVATAWIDQLEEWARTPQNNVRITLRHRLWLGRSISHRDPSRALRLMATGLQSRDPGLRLFAGLSISRLGDGRIPFRLTAPPEETREAREAWLADLKAHKPAAFSFADPFDQPVVQTQPGNSAVELLWLDEKANVVRRRPVTWPRVRDVLPDGTFFSRQMSFGHHTMALTSPTGETYGRFDAYYGQAALRGESFWCAARGDNEISQCAPWGEVLWGLPVAQRMGAPAGPGRILLVGPRIIDRRGDTVWKVDHPPDDPRWATMLDSDTVLVCGTKEIQIHHRTRGLLKTVGGFHSLGWVRYHPDRPWMIWDGGTSSVVVFNEKSGERSSLRIGLSHGVLREWPE